MGAIHQALLAYKTSVAGGGGLDPGSFLAGLDWFLDADTILGSDNDPVVDWLDTTASNFDYGQNTGARQPILKVALYNGHNAVRFGTNKCLVPDPTTASFGSANTLICVCTPSSAADYIVRGSSDEGRPAFLSGFNPGSGVKAFEYWNRSGGVGERETFDASASGLHILTLARTDDTGNYVGYFDGVEVFNVAVNTGRDWSGAGVAIIGAFTAGSSAYDGDIPMIIKFNQNHAGASGLDDLHDAIKAYFTIA
jgi:hypothetical protein